MQRMYRTKLKKAKSEHNDELVSQIEAAHSSIMMRQLTERLKVVSH